MSNFLRLPITFVIMALLGGSSSLRGQEPILTAFAKTTDGNWATTIKAPDGTETTYVYEPPTKFSFQVRTTVELLTPEKPIVRYTYLVKNDPTSKQPIGSLTIGPGLPAVSLVSYPVGWQNLGPVNGSVGLSKLANSVSGITRGGDGMIVLEGPSLPGVVSIHAKGEADILSVVPSGLTETQRSELEALAPLSFMATTAIGPAISAGIGEPELTLETLIARVGSHYTIEFMRSGHPRTTAIVNLFQQTDLASGSSQSGASRKILLQLQTISREAVQDPWHQELSTALGVCVDLMLSGAVPVRD